MKMMNLLNRVRRHPVFLCLVEAVIFVLVFLLIIRMLTE